MVQTKYVVGECFEHALSWTMIGYVAQMRLIARLIRHYFDVFTSNTITAVILFKYNFFLQHHYQYICFGMFCKEVFKTIHAINTLPATTRMGLHVGRKTNVIHNALPIHRIFEIAERVCRCIRWHLF